MKESGHWYLRDGQQLLTVPRKKDGHPIKTTLRHAKARGDLAPGCTTIIKESAKPQLVQWQVQQAILAALTLPRHADEEESAWLRRVEEDRQATARGAAEEGSRIHLALEQFFTGQRYDPAYTKHVQGVASLLEKECPGEQWQAEIGVTHSIGFGTKSDLFSRNVCLDFKGKDTLQKGLPTVTYADHWLQLAATREALRESIPWAGDAPQMRSAIVYVSRDEPGVAGLVWITPEQLEMGWRAFQCLTLHWQIMHNYAPDWCRPLSIAQEVAV